MSNRPFPFDDDGELERLDAEVSRSGRVWLLLPPAALVVAAVIALCLSS